MISIANGRVRTAIDRIEPRRFVKFAIVGATGAVLNLTILYLLVSGGLHYIIAGAIAIESAFVFNFFGNRAWTFSDVDLVGVPAVVRALARDHGVRLVGMAVNLALLWLLTEHVGLHYLLSQAVGAAVAAVWNFGGNVVWIWNP